MPIDDPSPSSADKNASELDVEFRRLFQRHVPAQEQSMPGWYHAPRGRARLQSTTIAPHALIDHPGAATELVADLRATGFNTVHVHLGALAPQAFFAELDQIRDAGIRIGALTWPANALAPITPREAEGSPAEHIETAISWVKAISAIRERPLLVLPSGWSGSYQPSPNTLRTSASSYSPQERGKAQRVLKRWIALAVRARLEIAIEPARSEVLQTAIASHRFMLENAGPTTGLALSPERLLSTANATGEEILRLLLDLVPWSHLLYIEAGDAWEKEQAASLCTPMLLARALRAPGVPPRLTIRGASRRNWRRASEEIRASFALLGLDLSE
jgi:sugar phosphate isomerase/epimerase